MAISRLQDICATKMDLKMESATLDEVVARIKQTLPGKKISVEVRGAKPIRVSFDLKGSSVGKVLTAVAALAGCKLYIFSSGLLIAPSSQLTEAENVELQQVRGGEWTRASNATEHNGWAIKANLEARSAKQRITDACASTTDLKLEGATLDDVLAHIKQNLPDQTIPIEVRGALPIKVSFDLKGINVGDALTPIAALAGCNVYVMNSGLLVTSPSQLTEAEKAEIQKNECGVWEDNVDLGGFFTGPIVVNGMKYPNWSVQKEARKVFSSVIAQEVVTDAKGTTTFGSFSHDSQMMLQQMTNWAIEKSHALYPQGASLQLTPGSSVSVVTSQEKIEITLKDTTSDPNSPVLIMTTYLK